MADTKLDSPAPFSAPLYDGAKKAFRMFPYFWMEDKLWEATRDGLVRDRDIVNEITLFCDHMHLAYMPEDMLSKFTTTLTKRISELKALGFPSVGINMLQTVGHGDFYPELLPEAPMQAPIDCWGNSSKVQLCPRSKEFKEFTMHKYTEFAKTGVEFLWVDDDFRVPDKNVSHTCFCDSCVAKFNEMHGFNYTAKELVAILDGDPDDATVCDLRDKWSEYNLQAYVDIMAFIKEAVNAVDPKIKLGLMVVHLPANAYLRSDFSRMAEALGAEMIRPGGGFQHEGNMRELFLKSAGIMGQMAQLPNYPDRQYEMEDFPQTYYKSGKTHALECTTAIMCGVNAIAFASIPPDNGNEIPMNAIRAHSEMWDNMVRVGNSWKLYGANITTSSDYCVHCDAGHFFNKAAFSFFNTLASTFANGFFPMSPYRDKSVVSLIMEDVANALTDDEIKDIFSRGVMLDGTAAEILVKRGYGDLIGCSKANYLCSFSAEKYDDHPFNESFVDTYRYMYSAAAEATYAANSAGMAPTRHFFGLYTFDMLKGAEALCTAYNVNREPGGTSSYIYENALGGRVAVFGYLPWSYFGVYQRTIQTKRMAEWLTRGQNPVKVMNNDTIGAFIKQPEDRSKFMLMLVNAIMDDTVDNMEVRVLGEYTGDFMYYDEKGVGTVIPASDVRVENGYTYFSLPKMTGWGFCVLYTI